MAIGSVKFFDTSKGFGFIIPEVEGNDVFVDKAAMRLAGMFDLEKGQRLSYEIEQDAKGAVKAAKLEVVEPMIPGTPAVNSFRKPSHRPRANARKESASRISRRHNPSGHNGIQHKNGNEIAAKHEWLQNYERYCELARKAGDDQVAREGYLQHAEHFYRMMSGSAT
jgi:CspA family cold shock protein